MAKKKVPIKKHKKATRKAAASKGRRRASEALQLIRSAIVSMGTWRLHHYDTFAGEGFTGEEVYASEAEAQAAARKELQRLEQTQPTASSGGQGLCGIQDRVFIVRPDGSMYRFLG